MGRSVNYRVAHIAGRPTHWQLSHTMCKKRNRSHTQTSGLTGSVDGVVLFSNLWSVADVVIFFVCISLISYNSHHKS